MIYNYKDLLKIYGNRSNINKALKSRKIYKLEHNIYSTKRIIDPLILYSIKYPYGVITLDSALYYYNLTDVIPQKVFLATPRNYRVLSNKNISQIFVNSKFINVGVKKIKIGNNEINMYNKERLLVEIIRKRKTMPFDYYKEIISNYREIVDELDTQKIEEYLLLYKNHNSIAETIEREVF